MPPLIVFLLLFVGTPLVELYFLIKVGSLIGALSTIALTLLTAVAGGVLVRMQGLSTAMKVRESAEKGEVPAIEMIEGLVLLISGFMLLLPGFVTDVIGFLFLVPPIRRSAIVLFLRRRGVIVDHTVVQTYGESPSDPRVIEGECEADDEPPRR